MGNNDSYICAIYEHVSKCSPLKCPEKSGHHVKTTELCVTESRSLLDPAVLCKHAVYIKRSVLFYIKKMFTFIFFTF